MHHLKKINATPQNSEIREIEKNNNRETLASFLYASLKNFYFEFLQLDFISEKLKTDVVSLFTVYYHNAKSSVLEWIEDAIHHIETFDEINSDGNYVRSFFYGLRDAMTFLAGLQWKDKSPVIDCVSIIKDADFKNFGREQQYADLFPKIDRKLALNTLLKSKSILTGRYFDIHYSHSRDGFSYLSSGELEMLNLYSRLKYIYDNPISGDGAAYPTLIFLDEVEIGFHPEWQRQFVNKLSQFISKIRNQTSPYIQVIYTTHSPITLSDMPRQCVNLLETDGLYSCNLPEKRKRNTFGANVFNLYGDSFFMENGLIGEFASEKIRQLSQTIENIAFPSSSIDKTHIDDLRQMIDMIGDKRIRLYLHSRLELRCPEIEIEWLKARIKQLESKQKSENEED